MVSRRCVFAITVSQEYSMTCLKFTYHVYRERRRDCESLIAAWILAFERFCSSALPFINTTYFLEHAFACERPEVQLPKKLDHRHHIYKAYDLYAIASASRPFGEI
jgi:hypothetical protein